MTPPSRAKTPTVIGLYGVSGCGKSHLLQKLRYAMDGDRHFVFLEGSEMIDAVTPGGLTAFRALDGNAKTRYRQRAIDTIRQRCIGEQCTAVVAGHYMFWDAKAGDVEEVAATQNDWEVYSHILYLDVDAEEVARRRASDQERGRPHIEVESLRKWQETEIEDLREKCREHGLLFLRLTSKTVDVERIVGLLRDFRSHTEMSNLAVAEERADAVVSAGVETALVLDADRTLAAADTGALLWKIVEERASSKSECRADALKKLFGSALGYSYSAFRQATLLYEEIASEDEFKEMSELVASKVQMYPDFVALLQLVASQSHIRAVIVTSGLRQVWEAVLRRERLSHIHVIGGGRVADGLVVTASVKAALVVRLQQKHQLHVWAFGDSPLDLEMLQEAHKAVVVVGKEAERSRSMDAELLAAISHRGLRAHQVLLPQSVPHRLQVGQLPIMQLTSPGFVNDLLSRGRRDSDHCLNHLSNHHCATARAASKLLMTPMRDASISGPQLRQAHQNAGRYLATEFLTDVIGLETYDIPHVQRSSTVGYRLFHEQQTLIVPLMRGGEPMAYGISETFPLASFLHAGEPADIKIDHLEGRITVLLVDSVINSGKSMRRFIDHVRTLHATVHIVAVAGVVQSQSVQNGGQLSWTLNHYPRVSLVSLRTSDNKYTGKGTTDTGNRLFNTTYLD